MICKHYEVIKILSFIFYSIRSNLREEGFCFIRSFTERQRYNFRLTSAGGLQKLYSFIFKMPGLSQFTCLFIHWFILLFTCSFKRSLKSLVILLLYRYKPGYLRGPHPIISVPLKPLHSPSPHDFSHSRLLLGITFSPYGHFSEFYLFGHEISPLLTCS